MRNQPGPQASAQPDNAAPPAHPDGARPPALPPAPAGSERIVIWPHRSLGRKGTCVVLAIAASGLLGTAAWVAQPAAVFVLVPAAAVFVSLFAAFRLSARRALRLEIIDISADMIRVMTSYLGRHQFIDQFSPHWVHVELRDDGHIDKRLILRQSGRAVSIGECLSPPEREELAAALRAHIERALAPAG